MRIKKGLELHNVCGENVIVAQGRENINFSKIVTLNESAALLWRLVEGREFTEGEMVKALLAEYEVEESVAVADVRKTIAAWQEQGMIE